MEALSLALSALESSRLLIGSYEDAAHDRGWRIAEEECKKQRVQIDAALDALRKEMLP